MYTLQRIATILLSTVPRTNRTWPEIHIGDILVLFSLLPHRPWHRSFAILQTIVNVRSFPFSVLPVLYVLFRELSESCQNVVQKAGCVEALNNALVEIGRSVVLVGVQKEFQRPILEVSLGSDIICNSFVVKR